MTSKHELRKQLLNPQACTGTVLAIDGDVVHVQTRRGREQATKAAQLVLSVGDCVLIDRGNVQGRVQREESVRVYRL